MTVALSACTINIGDTREEAPVQSEATTLPEPEAATTSTPASVDPLSSWKDLGDSENAFSQSELSQLDFGLFGLMSAPSLRMFKFLGDSWTEVTDQYENYFDLPSADLDYDITIQSVKLTDDDAIDFIVNYRVANWDVLNAENQGRDYGTALSGQGGMWRSVAFWDPYNDQLEKTSVEHIEYIDGALFGSGYGSCGRPCGLLIYEWVSANNRLEGVEASAAQRKAFNSRLNCLDFVYSEELPLRMCDEGYGVALSQNALTGFGYEIDADGYFGADTRLALQYYQRQKGLRATGEIDAATWKLLFEGVSLPGNDLNGDGYVDPSELSGT